MINTNEDTANSQYHLMDLFEDKNVPSVWMLSLDVTAQAANKKPTNIKRVERSGRVNSTKVIVTYNKTTQQEAYSPHVLKHKNHYNEYMPEISPLHNTNPTATVPVKKSQSFFSINLMSYLKPLIVSLVIFALFSGYLYYRRGFYDLYIMNKIFAGISAVLMGSVLLLGPVSRMFDRFDGLLKYRKQIGILAFYWALAHSVASYFFLEKSFPRAYFVIPQNKPFIFGLVGIVLLTILFIFSANFLKTWITPKRWWPLQYWGIRIAFVAVALHVFVMKYKGWIEWYKNGGSSTLQHPEIPGLGMLVGYFIAMVFIIRIAEALNATLGKIVTYISIPLLAWIYILTFIWGMQFLP